MLKIISDKVTQLGNLLVYNNAKTGQKSKSQKPSWDIFSGANLGVKMKNFVKKGLFLFSPHTIQT